MLSGDSDAYFWFVRGQSALLRVLLYILDKNFRGGNNVFKI